MRVIRSRLHTSASTLFASIVCTLAHGAEPPRTGADIYNTYCAVCHGGGWQGAPIANDAREWQSRVAAGAESLFKNAKQGLNGMPPLGTCADCSDEELKRAIEEMLPRSQNE